VEEKKFDDIIVSIQYRSATDDAGQRLRTKLTHSVAW